MKRSFKQGRNQKGISTIGIIVVIGIFGLLVVSFLKVFPMYLGNFRLQSVLEAMQQDVELHVKSKRAIWSSLSKRLDINEVRTIKREHVKMDRKDGKTTITVSYEIRDAFVGNLFIGASFNESIVINR
jgi:hypothetical protein